MNKMVVKEVVRDGDRVLLYGDDKEYKEYHVIASWSTKVRVGDEVTFEPCGCNFGWLVSL